MERKKYAVGVFPGGVRLGFQNTPLFSKRLGAGGKGNQVSLPPESPTLIGNGA